MEEFRSTFYDEINFFITLFIKWFPIFDSSQLIQNSKLNNFLGVCWFLCKNISNFVPPAWKLYNLYCHSCHMREGSGSQNIVARANWTIGSIYLWTRDSIFINFVSSTISKDISNKTETGNTNWEVCNSTSKSISSHCIVRGKTRPTAEPNLPIYLSYLFAKRDHRWNDSLND